jgi:MFS family permease
MSASPPQGYFAYNLPRFAMFWLFSGTPLWISIWVVFLQGRGLELYQLGVLDAIAVLLAALVELPSGALADRFGRGRVLAMGAVMQAIGVVGILAELLSPVFLLAFVVWNVSYVLFSGADQAFLHDALAADGRVEEYPKWAGRYLALQGGLEGIAALLGAWIAASVGMVACFVGSAALLLIGAAVGLTLREPPRLAEGEETPDYGRLLRDGVRAALVPPRIRRLMLLAASADALLYLPLYVLAQPHLTEGGAPLLWLGPLALAISVGIGAGGLMAGTVSARLGERPGMLGALLFTAASLLVLGAASGIPAILLFGLASVGTGVLNPLFLALLNRELASAHRATALSMLGLLTAAILLPVGPAITLLATEAGSALATAATGGLLVLLILALGIRIPARSYS